MSWLFGKKKHHKDSPTDSNEEDQSSSSLVDEFVNIEREGPPLPLDPTVLGGAPYPSGGLYPQINDMATYPPVPFPNMSRQHPVGDTTHYLSDVPFKLCKQLESNMNNDLDIDLLRVNEILSFIERIEEENYDYDFSLENSVITELNSAQSE